MPLPEFFKPCNARGCPQSPRCLRANRNAAHGFEAHVTPKGCPFYVDTRAVDLVRSINRAAPGAA